MKKPAKGVIIAVVIICLAGGAYLFFRGRHVSKTGAAGPSGGDSAPVALVDVEPVRQAAISEHITAYGDVVPAPGAIRVVSVPFESMISRVMVSERQKVSRGDPLLELKASPNTRLELEQARNANDIAGQKLAHVKELFALKLATNSQMLKAQESARQASARIESLKKRGVGGKRIINSNTTGLINKVSVQEGAIVPAGNPLVEIIAQDRLEVRLGVEPDVIKRLVSGQAVRLNYVNVSGAVEITGRIRKISRAVNPKTRLVDVFVTLPSSARYMLGEYILGRIRTASSRGLMVPRSAVLPEDGAHVLFTVKDGRAVRHVVQVILENDRDVQVSGPGLKAGDEAVIVGDYELKDGMDVKTAGGR